MKTIAIYPGSFNPFTIGHQNILEKAERIFGKDNVIVAVGINPEKKEGTYEIEIGDARQNVHVPHNYSRVDNIKRQLPSRQVEVYHGFLTDYVREKESEDCSVVVIRGLRNGYDFDYEYNQIRFMWDMHPQLNVMCLFADPAYMHVSSSAYRALEKIKPGSGHKYLSREVEDAPKVTTEMVEKQLSAVVVLNEESPAMQEKYDIVPLESTKEYNFKGSYSQCLEWIKENERINKK